MMTAWRSHEHHSPEMTVSLLQCFSQAASGKQQGTTISQAACGYKKEAFDCEAADYCFAMPILVAFMAE